MLNEILNPTNWKLFEVESQLKFAKENENGNSKKKPNYWVNSPQVISPLAIYKYLKARFGLPNGFISFLKNNTSDNLIHWHYSFKTSLTVIDILAKNSGLEILIQSIKALELKPQDWQRLIINLQTEFKKYGKQMSEVQSRFEHWSLFINPFARIEHTIQEYISKLLKYPSGQLHSN
jgi:hypothetical protein